MAKPYEEQVRGHRAKFAKRLIAFRTKHNLTQLKLAEYLQVSLRTVQIWEKELGVLCGTTDLMMLGATEKLKAYGQSH